MSMLPVSLGPLLALPIHDWKIIPAQAANNKVTKSLVYFRNLMQRFIQLIQNKSLPAARPFCFNFKFFCSFLKNYRQGRAYFTALIDCSVHSGATGKFSFREISPVNIRPALHIGLVARFSSICGVNFLIVQKPYY
jgi:hypothetical protein